MARFEDAAIDTAAKVFDEGAEHARIGPSDGEVTVQQDVSGVHVGFSVEGRARFHSGAGSIDQRPRSRATLRSCAASAACSAVLPVLMTLAISSPIMFCKPNWRCTSCGSARPKFGISTTYWRRGSFAYSALTDCLAGRCPPPRAQSKLWSQRNLRKPSAALRDSALVPPFGSTQLWLSVHTD